MSEKETSLFSRACCRRRFRLRLTALRLLLGIVLTTVFLCAGLWQYPKYGPEFPTWVEHPELLELPEFLEPLGLFQKPPEVPARFASFERYKELLCTTQQYNELLLDELAKEIPQSATSKDPTQAPSFLPIEDAERLCADNDLKHYPVRDRHRKIYDLFLVGTELDWTEIRLHELAPHVDYFVIVEAERSFTNKTKPLYFKKNWKHFSKFESKIIYHVLNDDAVMKSGNPWEHERYQRNALMTQVFPSLLGDKAPNHGDVIIVSDVDEIPRPGTLEKLRNCDIPELTGIRSQFFLYSFQWQESEGDWGHPQATVWQGKRTILPEALRMSWTRMEHNFPNASWHCTTCFQTVAELITKIEYFSHQEYNEPQFKDPDEIVRRVRNGIDVFERGTKYDKLSQDQLDVPQYLKQHPERFSYLLDRDPPNANFRDYLDGEIRQVQGVMVED